MSVSKFGDALEESKWGSSNRLISNKDFVGVEVELEGKSYGDVNQSSSYLTLWKVVEDGSLRNGCEFIFKEPLRGNMIINALNNLEYWIENHRTITVSKRCGVHVHLDIRDLEPKELLNLIMIYMMTERLLFNYVNPDRIKNNYCRPLTDSTFKFNMQKIIELSKSTDPVHHIMNYVGNECEKYAGLNLRPISTFGSIEFRMHQGTTRIKGLYEWINILFALKRTAREVSLEELLAVYNTQGYKALLNVIFTRTVLSNETLETQELIIKGVKDVEETLMFSELEKVDKVLRSRRAKALVGKRLIDSFIKNLED